MKPTTLRRALAWPLIAVVLGVWTLLGPAADAQPPNYGLDFAPVGAPGNRAVLREEVPFSPWIRVGRVNREFRITRTEVTTEQWFEFVQAYWPYWGGVPWDAAFTSIFINYVGPGQYEMVPGTEHWPAQVSWHNAARFTNWLHNGKTPGQWAFESGAYDTSTFTVNPNGTRNDQRRHSPGAGVWIPTWDELAKAAYYDPDRYGPGKEGYWLYPNATNESLISGLPWLGGQTSAGSNMPSPQGLLYLRLDVGSYPETQSPWGLMDVSGGVNEWTEDDVFNATRRVLGSTIRDYNHFFSDRIDYAGFSGHPDLLYGFRVASVPDAAGVCAFGTLVLAGCRRCRVATAASRQYQMRLAQTS